MKCPVCGGKLDFNLKVKSATCHTCGWNRILFVNGITSRIAKGSTFINTKKS